MTEPKIRFKRDDGSSFSDWEEVAFDSLYEPLNNNTYSRDCLNYESGKAKNIHYGDILVKFGEICDVQKEELPFINDGNAVQKYASLQDGDIVLADTAEDETVGKAIEMHNVNGENVISGLHTMACRPRLSFAPKYLGYYMNSFSYHSQLKPYMQGIKVTSIGRKNIAETMISYPSDEKEQQKIANFLSNVDEVIAASEEEVANLEQQKKAVMQKIFSQEVRFKKEDGSDFPDWEEKQLSELLVISNEHNKDGRYNQNDILACSLGTELDKKHLYFGLKATEESVKNYRIVSVGDMVYTKSPIKGFPNGIIRANKKTEGIVPSLYCVYHNESEICSEIIQAYFDTGNRLNNYLKKLVNVGARNNVNITDSGLLQGTIWVPVDKYEQQLIADFLTSYDEAITAAKQELAKWKELKKGLLQQMFV